MLLFSSVLKCSANNFDYFNIGHSDCVSNQTKRADCHIVRVYVRPCRNCVFGASYAICNVLLANAVFQTSNLKTGLKVEYPIPSSRAKLMCRSTLIPFLNGRTPPFLKSLFKSTQHQCHAFSRVTTPSQSISPPCCSMLLHSSTMPRNSNARLIYAIPLLLSALLFLCCLLFDANPSHAKPCRCEAAHILAIPCHSFAKHFSAFPLLLTALPILCVSIHFCSRASRRSTSQFLCVAARS